MDPNWRHIIPPNQTRVISEGHCIEDCTRRAFSRQGINVFATMMRTHQIGKEVRLRHIRNNVEFPAIAADKKIDPNYQEFRRLTSSVRVQPGDRLISECIYDSSTRDQITLGKRVSQSFCFFTHFMYICTPFLSSIRCFRFMFHSTQMTWKQRKANSLYWKISLHNIMNFVFFFSFSSNTIFFRWINDTRRKLCGSYVLLSTSKAINNMSFTTKLTHRFTFVGHRGAGYVRNKYVPDKLLCLIKHTRTHTHTHSKSISHLLK